MRNFFDIDALIPPAFDAHRRLIAACFERFVDRLPAKRQSTMALAQQALPADAPPELRLLACVQCSPTLHKLGQVLARDPRIDSGLRSLLQALEEQTSRLRESEIRPIVRARLGDAVSEFDIRLEPCAIGEGSVAVAWPVTWTEPGDGSRRRAVLKIPRPNIRDHVNEELAALADVAEMLDSDCTIGRAANISWHELFEDVSRLLRNEIDFQGEQRHLAIAARQYAGNDAVDIPALAPFCTDDITAMSHLDGGKVTDVDHLDAGDRRRVARRLATSLMSDVVFSLDSGALFHGDPHAGNVRLSADGRIGLIDWSLAATLTDGQRRAIAQMLIAGITLDAQALAQGISSLARRSPDESIVRDVAAASLGDLQPAAGPGLAWLLHTLDRSVIAGVQFADSAMILRKSFHTLTGVIRDVSPDTPFDAMLWSDAMAAIVGDFAARGLATPNDTGFAVRLSNADLLQSWMSLSLAPMRYWQRAMSRML